jgi:hypothetical protein
MANQASRRSVCRVVSGITAADEIAEDAELKRRFESVVGGIKLKPYPTVRAVANTYEIATLEYPCAKGIDPLALWDLHWVKELDDEGFIDALATSMAAV